MLIRKILFGCLTPQEIDDLLLAQDYRLSEHARGAIVYLQNERCNTLDLILQGNLVVQNSDEEGNVLTMSEFGAGDIIGVNLLFSQRNYYPMVITAKAKTTVLHLPKACVTKLCMSNEFFLQRLLQYLSDRSVFLTDKIKLIATKTIRQLITEFLIHEYHQQGSTEIKLVMTKKELAERFGISRTSLSRELQKMRQDGLLTYDRGHIYIRDLSLVKGR
ncbi:MAG: Crp/Fnr family transcriptional regulator [Firmicutes bacterium]|nr:Crp/Fnr family transcriptional regulator [Bacillota bacterium]